MVIVPSSMLPNKQPFPYGFCLFSIKAPTNVGEIAKHLRKWLDTWSMSLS